MLTCNQFLNVWILNRRVRRRFVDYDNNGTKACSGLRDGSVHLFLKVSDFA